MEARRVGNADILQIQREREEMERRDLRKMIMDGEAKQKEMKKKQQVG